MSQILEEMRDESRRKGIEQYQRDILSKMLGDDSFTLQKISEISGLSISEIENLKLQLAH